MKYILITGVSTGIGYDLTKQFIAKGYHVFGSVRKQEDADKLRIEIGEEFTPLIFDVTDQDGIRSTVKSVADKVRDQGLAGLINNAG